MNNAIADIRQDYRLRSLNETDVAADPITQFGSWWKEAMHSQLEEVNAMTLATVSPEGKPAARIVLLKDYDANGFVFFTNYDSEKGRDMAAHPFAALVFFWKDLERQVRIEGTVAKLDAAESDAYFHSRPQASRIGAWASPQSTVVADREELEKRYETMQARFASGNIPRPEHWGGYLVTPTMIEFWQGRPSRMHDRLVYRLQDTGGWTVARLAP
ncbi:pyridoxamine 5'-phosphate oxidase [Sediminibacterium soli]|uniref:pyridoxamine 5'-phosphate oxidase n=1 Tax=Sediminibacterium soli TaxID=2698829 RepID=UPI00137ACCB3|nr:pyridoxamine 5'-phosphate oxidase [Sediminibacterium soli]NCI45127.1 pyridoxamine 5'-phosphate oxidase [Sediminibacterium soli]